MTVEELVALIEQCRSNNTHEVIIVPSAYALIQVYGHISVYDFHHKIGHKIGNDGAYGLEIYFDGKLCITLRLVLLCSVCGE